VVHCSSVQNRTPIAVFILDLISKVCQIMPHITSFFIKKNIHVLNATVSYLRLSLVEDLRDNICYLDILFLLISLKDIHSIVQRRVLRMFPIVARVNIEGRILFCASVVLLLAIILRRN